MARSQKTKSKVQKPDKAALAIEIRTELRDILREHAYLTSPISQFQPIEHPGDPTRPKYFVIRGRHSVYAPFIGLRVGINGPNAWPDERMWAAFYGYAKSVWHLKDRLAKWAVATGVAIDRKTADDTIIHPVSNASNPLQICRSLSNWKKHSENHGVADARLGLVHYELSNSGVVEIAYDGRVKEHWMLVSNPTPIPFHVNVETDGGKTIVGDAATIIATAFNDWIPLIRQLRVLADGNPETKVLADTIFSN